MGVVCMGQGRGAGGGEGAPQEAADIIRDKLAAVRHQVGQPRWCGVVCMGGRGGGRGAVGGGGDHSEATDVIRDKLEAVRHKVNGVDRGVCRTERVCVHEESALWTGDMPFELIFAL